MRDIKLFKECQSMYLWLEWRHPMSPVSRPEFLNCYDEYEYFSLPNDGEIKRYFCDASNRQLDMEKKIMSSIVFRRTCIKGKSGKLS